MPTLAAPLDLAKYEARNLRAHQLGAAPSSPVAGQVYYNNGDNTLYWYDGGAWVSARGGASATPQATAGTQGTIQLAGDLAGTATAPLVAALAITDAKVAAANKDGTAGTPSLRTLGTGAAQAAAGNDARLSDARTPAGAITGDLAGSTYPALNIANLAVTAAKIANATITDTQVAAANKDGVAGTASLRTLGSGAQQAVSGTDARLSDSRAPSGSATGDLSGSYPNPQIATGVIIDTDVNATYKDGAVGVYSLRTLGSGALQAMPGNRTLDAITAPAANVSLNSKQITSLLDPTNPQDGATKNYVDSVTQGLDTKASVRLASTTNLSLTGAATIDGTAVATNDRILVKDQTTPSQNGIYVANTGGAWTRATDMDVWTEVPGAYVWVEIGTVNADTGWISTADQGGTIGTTSITWTQFAASGAAIAGAGLTKAGNTLDVVAGDTSLTVAADSVVVNTGVIASRAYADAQDLLSPLKTTTLTAGNGLTGGGDLSAARTFDVGAGTGITVAADTVAVDQTVIAARSYVDTQDALKQNAATASGYYSALLSGTAAVQTVTKATHGCRASRGLVVQVQDEATGTVVLPDLSVAATGDVTVTFGATVVANAYRLTVIG